MEKKIFESKGVPQKQTLFFIICSIVLAAGGIFFIILSNMKRKGLSIQTSFGSGSIGGGYVLSENARTLLMILGVVLVIFGILLLCGIFTMKKSVFTVYEGHIEGIQYAPLLIVNIKKSFNLEYSQIVDIQSSKGSFGQVLKIVTNGGNYGVILKNDGVEEFEYIKQRIKNQA